MKIFAFFVFLKVILTIKATNPTPIVIWHGMGDTCCNPLSIGRIKTIIEQNIPSVYVLSLQIGKNFAEDAMNGYFLNINTQISMACDIIARDPNLQNGFHALGFSQGGQFLRAVVQRCPFRVLNLVSVGGQHQGVFGFPRCPSAFKTICNVIRNLLSKVAYHSFVQEHLVQAEYWHDPLKEEEYINKSVFLSEINNLKTFNATYKTRLTGLNNLVLVKFLNDTMVVPKDSEWFEFYEPGQAEKIVPLTNSTIYTKDLLGLKALYNTNRIKFLSIDGDHLRFTDEWFISNIIKPYLT